MDFVGLTTLLDIPLIARIRRNHGLEHASMHILAQRFPGRSFSGHSDTRGFWLIGDVSTEEVRIAVQEALVRMRAGESNLAVHPNCGTNFVASGILAALAAFVAFLGGGHRLRDRLERLPLAASLAILALIVANPLGLALQRRITTSGEPGALWVVSITSRRRGRLMMHRVLTAG